MLTRCPACATAFRVTLEQIKARQGQVRCGRCQNVFNAIEHLTDTATVPETTAVAAEPIVESPATEELPVVESPQPAVPDIPASTETDEPEAETTVAEEVADLHVEAAIPPSPLSMDYAPESEDATNVRRWPWAVGIALAALALTIQILIAYRVELASRHPGMRPVLEALCDQLQCTIGLPMEADQLGIEASDLHPGAQKGQLELNATLRNHAAYAQSWPHLELTLTDTNDKPLARKVIEPALYLPAKQGQNSGFPPNSDAAVKVGIDPGSIPAVGYRLYLFYP